MHSYRVVVEYADHKAGMKNWSKIKEIVSALSAADAKQKVKECWLRKGWLNEKNQKYFKIFQANKIRK